MNGTGGATWRGQRWTARATGALVAGALLAGGAAIATADAPVEASKAIKSKVKLTDVEADGVKGKVTSKKKVCRKRLVSLWHLADVGSGVKQPVKLAERKSSKKGKFKLEGSLVLGEEYFVGAGKNVFTKFRPGKKPKRTVCGQTKSGIFALPAPID